MGKYKEYYIAVGVAVVGYILGAIILRWIDGKYPKALTITKSEPTASTALAK